MKRCTKCILPETYASLTFDEKGVCSVCNQIDSKKVINWTEREEELKKILSLYKEEAQKRGSKYDCILPFGGGKDSTYTLYTIKEKYGMNPLTVTFNMQFMTETGLENFHNVLNKLGVDNLCFSPDMKLVKKLCVKSLKKNGDWCWHCHAGIFAWSTKMAVKFNIPLMIFGEPASEYSSYYSYEDVKDLDEEHLLTVATEGITAKDFVSEDISMKDLEPFIYPSVDEIKRIGLRQIYLGSYTKWDTYEQVKLVKEKLGWKGANVEGSFLDYDKVDCKYVGIRDYLKFIKRGYGRSAQLASIEVRHGRMTRDGALKVAEEYDGKRPKSLDNFLSELGVTEDLFMEIANSHIVNK